MFRFTIRDVLWLMVVVAMAVGWWAEHREYEHKRIRDSAYDRWCIAALSEVVKARTGGQVTITAQSVKIAFPDGSGVHFPYPSDKPD